MMRRLTTAIFTIVIFGFIVKQQDARLNPEPQISLEVGSKIFYISQPAINNHYTNAVSNYTQNFSYSKLYLKKQFMGLGPYLRVNYHPSTLLQYFTEFDFVYHFKGGFKVKKDSIEEYLESSILFSQIRMLPGLAVTTFRNKSWSFALSLKASFSLANYSYSENVSGTNIGEDQLNQWNLSALGFGISADINIKYRLSLRQAISFSFSGGFSSFLNFTGTDPIGKQIILVNEGLSNDSSREILTSKENNSINVQKATQFILPDISISFGYWQSL